MGKRLTRRELLRRGACAGVATGLAALGGIDGLAHAVAREVNGDSHVLGGGSCGGNVFYRCESQAAYSNECQENPYDCAGSAAFNCHVAVPEGHSVTCKSDQSGATFACLNAPGETTYAYRCDCGSPVKRVGFKCNVGAAGYFRCGNGSNDQYETSPEFYCNTDPDVNLFHCDAEGIVPGDHFACQHGAGPGNPIGDYRCNSTAEGTNYAC